MRVVEVATQAEPNRVMAEYEAAYQTTHGYTAESVQRWAARIRDEVGIRQDMAVVVRRNADGEYDVSGRGNREELIKDYADAGLEPPDDPLWSLSFEPWGGWREMEVLDETDDNLTTDQLAAHLMYEMLWHGWPEETEVLRDELLDMVESIERGTTKTTPFDPEKYLK